MYLGFTGTLAVNRNPDIFASSFRLCKSFEISGDSGGDVDGGGGGPGSVLGRFRGRFVAVDRDKTGFINRAQFRAVLASLPGTQDLTVRTC